jgi:hypothetical protein
MKALMILKKQAGLIFTLVVGSVLIFYFYGAALFNYNTTFFASDGDGLKDYFGAYYYIKYDTGYFHSSAMNYPHGEHVFFTGNQPSISVVLKVLNKLGMTSAENAVGVINLFMLFSLFLGILFLYLFLVHLKLPPWYSMLVSIGIIFLSPQLARMPGHFSLSYVFAIPAMLYLMARFHEHRRIWLSAVIGIFVLWALGTHVYMLGFHASIILFYWIYSFVFFKGSFKESRNYLHITLQFILPLLLFTGFMLLTDEVTDRTSYPWGFLVFKAVPESIFLPLGKPYGQLLYKISSFHYVQWESVAYIGFIAVTGFIIMIFMFFLFLFTKRFEKAGTPSENTLLNIYLWASLVMLLYSFGFPFIIRPLEFLVHYIGPLKQMRGIARFSWLFFYVINIFIFYHIWNLKFRNIHRALWLVMLVASLSFLWYDAWLNVNFWSRFVNNKIPALNDVHNQSEENEWVHKIDPQRYQASVPIPYFHIGSENYWLEGPCGIFKNSILVSWKTGIPSMGVMLSRTSLSQTLENLELFLPAYRKPVILDKLQPEKPFLLITAEQCENIPEYQQDFIKKAIPLFQTPHFSLYELAYDSVLALKSNPYESIKAEIQHNRLYAHAHFFTSQPLRDFITDTAEQPNNLNEYILAEKTYTDKYRSSAWIYHREIPAFEPEKEFILSFWVNNLNTDLAMRSRLQIEIRDQWDNGHDLIFADLHRVAKAFDGEWVLIEQSFRLQHENHMIRWRIRNKDLFTESYDIKHIMIRPVHTNVYQQGDKWLMKNNRFYLRDL